MAASAKEYELLDKNGNPVTPEEAYHAAMSGNVYICPLSEADFTYPEMAQAFFNGLDRRTDGDALMCVKFVVLNSSFYFYAATLLE